MRADNFRLLKTNLTRQKRALIFNIICILFDLFWNSNFRYETMIKSGECTLTLCSLNSTILHFKEHERCPSKLQNFKLQFQECLHFDEVNLLSVCITTWVLYNNNIKRNNCCMVTKGQKISKANFEVFLWTKKRTKIFLYFCSNL